MKKSICIILLLLEIIQFSDAQVAPSEIYSSKRFWRSDKTKTGTGFKFRNATNVKRRYTFAIYKDCIKLTNKESTLYKINKIDGHYLDATHYLVSNSSGQPFLIIVGNVIVDNKHSYDITVIKTAKDGKTLSVTKFDVKKLK